MNPFAISRLDHFLHQHQYSAALLTNPATITWLCGYAPPIQTGASPFEGGPAIGWYVGGQLVLLLSDMEAPAAQALGVETREYSSYTIEKPLAGFQNQAMALRELLSSAGHLKGKVAVEFNYLSASAMPALQETLQSATLVPVDEELPLLRTIKSPEEVQKIKASLALSDYAQDLTRNLIRVGVSEIEVWGQLKAGLEQKAGCRLPLLADFVAGKRTAEIGGLPGEYRLQAGDAVIADIVPRYNGYWGDNAGTHFVGDPRQSDHKVYQVVLDTLQKGLAAIKPGVRACDLDAMLRDYLQQQGYPVYPHHTGHGLGVTYHEEPRIVPYNTLTLEAGMVLAIEPGIYLPDEVGVRLEDVVLVTSDGCERLTHHLQI